MENVLCKNTPDRALSRSSEIEGETLEHNDSAKYQVTNVFEVESQTTHTLRQEREEIKTENSKLFDMEPTKDKRQSTGEKDEDNLQDGDDEITNYVQTLLVTINRYNKDVDLSQNPEIRRMHLKKELESRGVSCVMTFKGCRVNKRAKKCLLNFVEYAICKHKNCRLYKFVFKVMEQSIDIRVFMKGKRATNHTEAHSYWLKGIERKLVKKELLKTLPNVVRCEDIRNVDSDLIQDGNWQHLRSLAVYQKARSEAFADEDKHTDPYIDLLLRSKDEPAEQRYIQYPDGRTLVYLYSKQQIKTLIRKGQKIEAYFDSTGSVVRPSVYDEGHRVFYYAVVVNVQSKIVPVAELISSKHDSATITNFLLQFKHFVRIKCHRSWPIFNVIVTDWSFALITSVCQSFNDMTLYMYLKVCYRFVTNTLEDARFTTTTIITSCCAHFIKMVCRKVSKLRHSKHVRNVMIDGTAVLMQCSSMTELQHRFENVVTILLNPYLNDNVKSAIQELSSDLYMKGESFMRQVEKEEYDFEEDDDDETVRGEYINSPFFLHYFKIYEKISSQIGDRSDECNVIPNEYKSEEFCQYLLKRLMPFVPLWTDILNVGRHSNSNVESWFKTIKREVLNSQNNLKVGRFVTKTREKILVELKSIELNIGKTPRNRHNEHRSKSRQGEIDNPAIEEQWKKKPRKAGFLYGKNLRLLKDKFSVKNSSPPDLISENEGGIRNEKVEIQTIAPILIEDDVETKLDSVLNDQNSNSRINRTVEEKPGEGTLNNGLFFSNEFYMSSAMKCNFFLGVYKYTLTQQSVTLTAADYKSLISTCNSYEDVPNGSERWLTDYCLDALGFSILNSRTDIYYVDTVSTQILFSDVYKTYKTFTPVVKSLEDIRYVLLPYNENGQHWTLIVLDKKNRYVYILNPSSTIHVKENLILEKMKRFLSTRDRFHVEEKLCWRKWKISEINLYPKQEPEDGINCGVFVIFYVYIISKINEMDGFQMASCGNLFDPEHFRITLQNMLLLSSEIVYDKCFNCGRSTEDQYVECSVCYRWLHVNNCSMINQSLPISTIEQPNFIYKCYCCAIYGNDPFKTKKTATSVTLTDVELETFVIKYKDDLKDVYSKREFNEEARRYRETSDPQKHLKWDYSVAFISLDACVSIFKFIQKHTHIENTNFICYVLLGILNTKLVKSYYGLTDEMNICQKYKDIHDIDTFHFDYPVPYTLDEVLEKITNERK